ncbi:MAG: signal peptidase I, partial [Caulobacteraceae bacterium]
MKPTGVAIVMVSAVLAGVCLMIVAPLAVRTLVYEPYTVPSAAMEPTLQQGDYLIVSKAAYGYGRHSIWGSPPGISGRIRFHSPERGDVVVFKLPRDGRTSYIKRLIGQPGDKVQITRGIVSINGKSLPQQPVRSIATTDGGPPGRAEVLRE